MNVRCPSCQTVFRVDPTKVPDAGVRARCTVCEGVFGVYPEPSEAPVRAPTAAPEPARSTPEPKPAATIPGPPPAPAATPVAPWPAAAARPVIKSPPPVAPPVARPSVSPGMPAGRGAGIAPRAGGPKALGGPAAAPRAAPGAAFNPFLSHDPRQKARRLARALVSDLVVYHPEKRERGLKEGTLKELFDEEIKKSWDEYEEQVGKEMAESTTFFNDALNEILGDGSSVF
ncbi:MAG: hypothetical protein HKM89_06650 [Gemmatimonadales bacterium]|nr:hypothetical protein [Gemmatimonadales bacterium]